MGASAAKINTVRFSTQIGVTQDLQDVGAEASQAVQSSAYDPGQHAYTPASTPPMEYYSSQVLSLVAGAATIDLTALPGLQANIDLTGKKVRLLRIRGEADGSNGTLVISPGAANPYPLFGAGNDFEIKAGLKEEVAIPFGDGMPAVAAGVKEIDLAGAGTDSWFVEIFGG